MAIQADRKKIGYDNFVYKQTTLPKDLKEAESTVVRNGDLLVLLEVAKGIYAWDSAGKNWYLPRRKFRELQREVQVAQAAGALDLKPYQTI